MHEPGRGRFRFWRGRRRRVRYVALLPTLLTLANGVCGFLAIVNIGIGLQRNSDAHYQWAGYLILIAMVFDALDGKVARATRTATSFGAQMDSLCDLVTFGIAPGFLVYAMSCPKPLPAHAAILPERVVLVVSVFYAMCTLVRLARFNVESTPDDASHQEFSGLPSPAAAGAIASAVIPWDDLTNWPVIQAVWNGVAHALPFMAFVLGVLMVSRIRYAHIVNQLFRGFRPFVRLVEIAIVALLVVIFHEVAIFLAFAGYALMGPVLWARARLFRRPAPATPPQPADQQDNSFF